MPAVSDAGPLIHLAQIRKLSLLERLFGIVIIIPRVGREVIDEGIRLGYPDAILVSDAVTKGYIVVRKPGSRILARAAKLAKREKISLSDSQTILMAKAVEQPLLTDEKPLSVLGRIYGLKVWNTWSILMEALRLGFVEKRDIQEAIEELAVKRHKLSAQRAKEILESAEKIAASQAKKGSKGLVQR